jgi:UMF1 family MFS transporter
MSALSDPTPTPAPLPLEARRRIWGWWAFDWASQPYFTLCLTFIFGPYFAAVATESFMASGLTSRWPTRGRKASGRWARRCRAS